MSNNTISSFAPAKSSFFRDAWVKIAAAFERRTIRARLHALDDHLLKDMGISRSDINRIARSGPSQRRTDL